MWEILKARNLGLLHDLNELVRMFMTSTVPPELGQYKERILSVCSQLRNAADRNLADIALGRKEILEDVLSNTQQVMQYVRLLSARLAAPIVRACPGDRLSLTTITWVHKQHPVTTSIPAAFADGDCSVWPFVRIAPIYFFPSLEQSGLLFQPLLFHEFGHLLYVSHKKEMDDLVGELQREVEEVLLPPSQRSDRHADVQAAQRQVIVDTWYRWSQELFCDAVGLIVGGPCLLLAISGYLGTMQRGDFYRQPIDLQHSEHPVTWLRVRLLTKRARRVGFVELATEVEDEWKLVAQTMGVVEDYHGFYDDALEGSVVQKIDDMLTEAEPRQCTESEARGDGWDRESDFLVPLLNHAWRIYRGNPTGYAEWEAEAVRRFFA
jgi:hypothetical protein